jgi:hypothetical protein
MAFQPQSKTNDDLYRPFLMTRYTDDNFATLSTIQLTYLHQEYSDSTAPIYHVNSGAMVYDAASDNLIYLYNVNENCRGSEATADRLTKMARKKQVAIKIANASGGSTTWTKLDGSAMDASEPGGTSIDSNLRVIGSNPNGHTFLNTDQSGKTATATASSVSITLTAGHTLSTNDTVFISGATGTGSSTVNGYHLASISGNTLTLSDTSGMTGAWVVRVQSVWGWVSPPASSGVITTINNAGRMVLMASHRNTLDTSGTPYPHCLYSDDHGITWRLAGGLNESVSGNGNLVEGCVTELASGNLFAVFRKNGTGLRYSSTSADSGATWSNAVQISEITTGTATQGDIRKLSNGNHVMTAILDPNAVERAALTLYLSTDNCATWPYSRTVEFGNAGYCSLVALANKKCAVLYETWRGVSDVNYNYTDIANATVDDNWIKAGNTAHYVALHFTEELVGAPLSQYSATMLGHGTYRFQAKAGKGNVSPLAIETISGRKNVKTNNGSPAQGIFLHKVGEWGMLPMPSESCTWTFGFAFNFLPIVGPLLSNRGAGAAAGVLIEVVAGPKIKATVADSGAAIKTVTASGNFVAGFVSVVFDRNANTLEIFYNGVSQGSASTAGATNIANSGLVALAYTDHSGYTENKLTLLRFDRNAVTAGKQLTAISQESFKTLIGSDPSPIPAGIRTANMQAYFFPTTVNGIQAAMHSGAGCDGFLSSDVLGSGCSGGKDIGPNKYTLSSIGSGYGLLRLTKRTVGSNSSYKEWSNNVAPFYGSKLNSILQILNSDGATSGKQGDLSFVHKTSVFCICGVINVDPTATGGIACLDYGSPWATGGNNGWTIGCLQVSGATWKPAIYMSGGNAPLLSGAFSNTFTTGTSYWFAFLGNGPGTPMTMYLKAISPGATVGNGDLFTGPTPSGTTASESAYIFTYGATGSNSGSSGSFSSKDIIFYDTNALSLAELQAIYDLACNN